MRDYNLAFKKNAYTFDAGKFSENLKRELEKRPNFSVRCSSEVCSINYNKETGTVESVGIVGKSGKDIKCDALVLCTGAATSQILYQQLRVISPLIPIKGITFDFKTKVENLGKHIIFDDTKLVTTQITDGLWRASAYGDISGFDRNFDQRRVRNMVRLVCKVFDSKEPLQH